MRLLCEEIVLKITLNQYRVLLNNQYIYQNDKNQCISAICLQLQHIGDN